MDWSIFDRGVFLVNVLGIIYNPKTRQILIGKREDDLHIKELSWCFPGGRPGYEDELEFYLKHEIKTKTGLDVDVKRIVFTKTYPEKRELLSVYYYCEVVRGRAKAGEKFVEIRWIRPSDAQKYFTTSIHPLLSKYLKILD